MAQFDHLDGRAESRPDKNGTTGQTLIRRRTAHTFQNGLAKSGREQAKTGPSQYRFTPKGLIYELIPEGDQENGN